MGIDTAELFRRYNRVEREIEYRNLRRKEIAEGVVSAISSMSEEDIKLVQKYVPEVTQLKALTVDTLMANQNNEYALVRRVADKLYGLADEWLKHFEDAL